MKQVAWPGGGSFVPAIGQGTWGMGEVRGRRAAEVAALRLGISLGLTLIDTATLYGAGGAESVVGEAIADCRDQVFLVSKVWPSHAAAGQVQASVHGSLQRLRTNRLDAVLLHWPTRSVPLAETLGALAELQAQGLVGTFGVSNFDLAWLRAAAGSGAVPAVNQVPYSLRRRGVENAILPYAQSHGQVVMAYSPLGHRGTGRWPRRGVLEAVGAAHGVTAEQVALAFVISRPGVVAIPKAVGQEHIRANAAAGDLVLTTEDIARLEAAFPCGRAAGLALLPPRTAFFRLVEWAVRVQAARG